MLKDSATMEIFKRIQNLKIFFSDLCDLVLDLMELSTETVRYNKNKRNYSKTKIKRRLILI